MKATELYEKLEHDFINPNLSDEWAIHMNEISEYLCDNFKKRSMGLVCDFANEISQVYTAVFPSSPVMKQILDSGAKEAMLFVHHPSIWDIRRNPVFYQMDKKLLQRFKERNISIYNLHVPLDNFGPYSTSVSLAKALGIESMKPFSPYFGALCGVFGKCKENNVEDLKKHYESVVGHKISLYKYGEEEMQKSSVAVIAGGGNSVETLEDIAKEKVNVLITGISARNSHSIKAHDFAKANKISILGATHYSTEKFACIAMVDYFKKLGLNSEFIADAPVFEDM